MERTNQLRIVFSEQQGREIDDAKLRITALEAENQTLKQKNAQVRRKDSIFPH